MQDWQNHILSFPTMPVQEHPWIMGVWIMPIISNYAALRPPVQPSSYHHHIITLLSRQLPAASNFDSSIPRLRGRLFIFSLWVRRQATAPRMQVKPVEAGNGWWLTWSLCGNHNRIYPGLKRSKYIQINPNKTIRHWNAFLNVIKWN